MNEMNGNCRRNRASPRPDTRKIFQLPLKLPSYSEAESVLDRKRPSVSTDAADDGDGERRRGTHIRLEFGG
jgi:hypothetical protein